MPYEWINNSRASSRGIRRIKALSGFKGLKERGGRFKSVVKVCGSTVKLQLILGVLSTVEAGGIRGVAVKCLDITKNSDCEGSLLDCN